VRLGAERQARAAARAAADGISLGELLRRAVDAYLDRRKSSEQGQPPRE
jgi:predicted HicB family RNase H-like nuclease